LGSEKRRDCGGNGRAKESVGRNRKTAAGDTSRGRQGRQELDLAKEQLALYSPKFLDRLKAFVRQAEEGYAQSATTLIIYLDAKRTYFDTLTDYYEALGNVARARAELESAVGVPLELNP
jgi:outer membrane protein TolC